MRFLPLAAVTAAIALSGCIGPGRAPHAFLPPIAEEYHVCAKCGSLNGGMYGKGPIERLHTARASKCWHRWRQIARQEFQRLGAQRFSAEWEHVSPYVKRP